MTHRKARIARINKAREERKRTHLKEIKYRQMSKEGVLGKKDFRKYCEWYCMISEGERGFYKSPEELPKRNDYNLLKKNLVSLFS